MKITKARLRQIILENILENDQREGLISDDDDRREGLISMIYDIMMDNRSGNREEDFIAAKEELESDGKATTDELDEIELDDVLQMGGRLVSEQELKQITFERWQELSGVK